MKKILVAVLEMQNFINVRITTNSGIVNKELYN